ncbi:hypothetical protein LCGC14_1881880 [marine sediment metagenome]|uniref:Uncharacterized protein n=1 Tax=marine sediment metagenome TaxID=412755 RepID=A0A0F9G206_9ZZZZ
MAKVKTRIGPNLLRISTTHGDTETDITKTELQTQLDHKRLDKQRVQLEIKEIEADIEMLNI